MTPSDFKTRRQFLGYTQTEFAQRLGLSLRTVQYYESGEVPINRTVELLLDAIELDEK
jgi:transcriptional regulator with XRE-family HTH domain